MKPASQAGIRSSREAPACQAMGASTAIGHDLTISTARADARFASALQHGDEPSAAQVHQAIVAAIRAFGIQGCGTGSAGPRRAPGDRGDNTAGITQAGRPLPAGLPGPANQRSRASRGFMDTAPGPAEWFAWWSWPWRVASAGTSSLPSFAPQALSQPILPGWPFANSINVTEENSSSPETEREIVAAHSYGQQLGRIIDVLDELIRKQPAGSLDARPVREFAQLRKDIETIKAHQAQAAKRVEQMITDLAGMKRLILMNTSAWQRNSGKPWKTVEIEGWRPVSVTIRIQREASPAGIPISKLRDVRRGNT